MKNTNIVIFLNRQTSVVLFLSVLLFFTSFKVTAQPISGKGNILDKVVALVGSESVLLSDVTELEKRFMLSGVDTTSAGCYALESLFQEKLLVYGAKADNVEVTDKELEAEVDEFLEEVLTNPSSRYEIIDLYGSIDAYKQRYRPVLKNQLLAQKFKRQLTSDIEVTPAEVRTVFDNIPHDQLPEIKKEVQVELIVMKDSSALTAVRQKVVTGSLTMEKAVELYSTDPLAKISNGIFIHSITNELRVPVDELPPAIFFAVEELNIGEVSDVFKYDGQYAIARIAQRYPRHTLDYEQDYYKIQLGALQEKRERVLREWFDKAVEEAYIHVDPMYKDCHLMDKQK